MALKATRFEALDLEAEGSRFNIFAAALQFVGPDHWIYVAVVCKEWHAMYRKQIEDPELTETCDGNCGLCPHDNGLDLTTVGVTSRKAAFGSVARLHAALEAGMVLVPEADNILRPSDVQFWDTVVVKHGALDALVEACKLGMPLSPRMLAAAAKRGSLPLVKWLHEQGCRWSQYDNVGYNMAAHDAAEGGHVDVLRYMKEQGVEFNGNIFLAGMRHMRTIEYFLNEGMKVEAADFKDEDGDVMGCCYGVAAGGELAALQFVHQYAFLWDDEAAAHGAVACGSIDMLDWLASEGVTWDSEQLASMLFQAGVHNRVSAAMWLLDKGAEWPDDLHDDDPGAWTWGFLGWARSAGCPL